MGQKCKANDVDICRKHTTQYSDPRVHYAEECLKAEVQENCQYTVALTQERLKLFAQLFLSISSVFTEQSQKCVKNVTPAIIAENNTSFVCQVFSKSF